MVELYIYVCIYMHVQVYLCMTRATSSRSSRLGRPRECAVGAISGGRRALAKFEGVGFRSRSDPRAGLAILIGETAMCIMYYIFGNAVLRVNHRARITFAGPPFDAGFYKRACTYVCTHMYMCTCTYQRAGVLDVERRKMYKGGRRVEGGARS